MTYIHTHKDYMYTYYICVNIHKAGCVSVCSYHISASLCVSDLFYSLYFRQSVVMRPFWQKLPLGLRVVSKARVDVLWVKISPLNQEHEAQYSQAGGWVHGSTIWKSMMSGITTLMNEQAMTCFVDTIIYIHIFLLFSISKVKAQYSSITQ